MPNVLPGNLYLRYVTKIASRRVVSKWVDPIRWKEGELQMQYIGILSTLFSSNQPDGIIYVDQSQHYLALRLYYSYFVYCRVLRDRHDPFRYDRDGILSHQTSVESTDSKLCYLTSSEVSTFFFLPHCCTRNVLFFLLREYGSVLLAEMVITLNLQSSNNVYEKSRQRAIHLFTDFPKRLYKVCYLV